MRLDALAALDQQSPLVLQIAGDVVEAAARFP
jgi:hypothetical protein